MIRKFESEEDLKQIDKLGLYCFGGQGYKEDDKKEHFPLDCYLGVFEEVEKKDGSKRNLLTSGMIMIPFVVKAAQSTFQCYGIRSVVSKPEYRNKGQIRKLFQECFRIMKEKGIPLTNLYPFKMAYYEKFGYSICEEVVITKFNPGNINLRRFPESKTLQIQEVYGNEIHEDIKEVYDQVCQTKYDQCLLERSKWCWNELMMRNQVFQFVCYDTSDENKPVGYIIWHFVTDVKQWYTKICGIEEKDVSSRRAFIVREMNWTTPEVKIELFRFLWKHRDQLTICGMLLPTGEEITPYFSNHFDVKRFTYSKSMMKILLLKEVVEKINDLPKHFECSNLMIKIVNDPMCPWNEGVWRLEKKLGESNIAMMKVQDSEAEEFDVCLDIKQMNVLVMGHRNIEDLLLSYGKDSLRIKDVKKVMEGLRCFERRKFNYFNDLF